MGTIKSGYNHKPTVTLSSQLKYYYFFCLSFLYVLASEQMTRVYPHRIGYKVICCSYNQLFIYYGFKNFMWNIYMCNFCILVRQIVSIDLHIAGE